MKNETGLIERPRRLRRTAPLRKLLRETHLAVSDFILPLFIKHGEQVKTPIHSMPGHYQMSLDRLAQEIIEISELGILGVILFAIPEEKCEFGSSSYQADGLIPKAIQLIKELNENLIVISDICCCEYTTHGHCGVLDEHTQEVNNDKTLPIIAKQAVAHAQAGVDMVAPSGMMDGQVAAIREALDSHHFTHIPILSYAVKYASQFYGPFREAAQGAPQFGDRKGYQMDYANTNEALREVRLDVEQGADLIMVKPAHSYLDIIYRIKQAHPDVPLAAYHVSGEFAMLKAAAKMGWLDEMEAAKEVLTSIKRAGADFIITYYAKELAAKAKLS